MMQAHATGGGGWGERQFRHCLSDVQMWRGRMNRVRAQHHALPALDFVENLLWISL